MPTTDKWEIEFDKEFNSFGKRDDINTNTLAIPMVPQQVKSFISNLLTKAKEEGQNEGLLDLSNMDGAKKIIQVSLQSRQDTLREIWDLITDTDKYGQKNWNAEEYKANFRSKVATKLSALTKLGGQDEE